MKDENLKLLINVALLTVAAYIGYLIYSFNKEDIDSLCFYYFSKLCKRRKDPALPKKGKTQG